MPLRTCHWNESRNRLYRSALPGSQCPPQLRLTDGPLGASPAGGSLSWLLPCRFCQRLRSLFCLSPPPALVFWTPLFSKPILRYRQTHPISLSLSHTHKSWSKAAAGSVKQFSQSLASWGCITVQGTPEEKYPGLDFSLCPWLLTNLKRHGKGAWKIVGVQASSLTLDLRTSSHQPEAEHSFFLDLNLNILKQLSDSFCREIQFVMPFSAQGPESLCRW